MSLGTGEAEEQRHHSGKQCRLASCSEEHQKRLSDAELYRLYERADQLLAATQDTEDIARLRACARVVARRLYGPELDEYFTLPEVVVEYEARFVERALVEEDAVSRGLPKGSASLIRLLVPCSRRGIRSSRVRGRVGCGARASSVKANDPACLYKGVTAGRVRQMIIDRQLPTTKMGRDNFILETTRSWWRIERSGVCP